MGLTDLVCGGSEHVRVLWDSSHAGLWAVLVCKLIEACSYMMCALTLKQYLVENFGFSDVDAGYVYGVWGLCSTLYGLLLGVVIDKVGVRWSLLTGGTILCISRVWLALTLDRNAMLFNLFLFLPIGCALGMPVKYIAVKRYTPAAVGSIAYGLLYLFLNAGYFAAGFLVDLFRKDFDLQYSEEGKNGKIVEFDEPVSGVEVWDQMTAYRWLQLYSAVMTAVFLCIAFVFVHDVEVALGKRSHRKDGTSTFVSVVRGTHLKNDEDLTKYGILAPSPDATTKIKKESKSGLVWGMQPYRHKPKEGVLEIVALLGTDKVFWLTTALCVSILGVRMLFRHLDATFPQYMERELGDDVKLGAVFSMNPLAVVIFLAFLTPIFSNANVIWTMIGGMIITAAAPLWLTIEPAYWTGVMFMVTMALGESIWMPKFMDLTISKACPDGEEGIFTALVNAPTFFAKFLSGVVSGYLLDHYCPEEGERDSKSMWLIIAAISLSSPLIVGTLHFCNVWSPLKDGMTSSNEKKQRTTKHHVENEKIV